MEERDRGLNFTVYFAARWVRPLMAFVGNPDNELIEAPGA